MAQQRLAYAGIGALSAAYAVSQSVFTGSSSFTFPFLLFLPVEGGHRGVLFSRLGGVGDHLYGEGMHLRVPWLQWPLIYDIRSRAYKVVSPSGTADLQMVDIGLRVLYRPNPVKIQDIAQQIGDDFSDKILPSIIHETLKSAIAEFSAQSLLTEREKVKNMFNF